MSAGTSSWLCPEEGKADWATDAGTSSGLCPEEGKAAAGTSSALCPEEGKADVSMRTGEGCGKERRSQSNSSVGD